MTGRRPASAIEYLMSMSGHRWALAALAVFAALAASSGVGAAAGRQNSAVLVVVFVLGLAAVVRPGTHTAAAAVAIVVWQWLAIIDDRTTPWVIPVASCLLVFHAAIALMAVTPITVEIDRVTVRRWVTRTLLVGLVTVPMWAAANVMESREFPGSAALTMLGFATLRALVLVVRREIDRVDDPGNQADSHAG